MLKIQGLEQQLGPFYWPIEQQEKQPNFPTNYAVKDDEDMYQAAIIKGNVKCLFLSSFFN